MKSKYQSFVGDPINTQYGQIFVNPGEGPVEGATLGHARQNISQLILDVGFELNQVKVEHYSEDDEAGRFCFVLTYQDKISDVEMPGLDLSKVRYMDNEDENIWDFPRLYVDGSSWVWFFAINCVRSALTGSV